MKAPRDNAGQEGLNIGSDSTSAQERLPLGDASKKHVSSHLPTVNLPKGGGAIRGIGEKFTANPVTGTGSLSVTISTSPGRSGFGPQLSISYDSGAGNGPFGLGWNLSLPSITRKTEKGLPKYHDAEESDVFVLSGVEDLVPVLREEGGKWVKESFERIVNETTYQIQRYRPRTEGLFARIERWTNQDHSKDTFWRSISKDNITTWYGKSDHSRTVDPFDSTRIFSWLICESYDDKGNAIVYEYQSENSQRIFEDQDGQIIALAHERNRNDMYRAANRYLKRIKYGNREPNRDPITWQATDPTQLPSDTWMFEVVFDYDEGHYFHTSTDAMGRQFAVAMIDKTHDWSVRPDAFSSYRAGFEIRTYRLCHRVLMFHHFPDELGVDDYLVRSTEFQYNESPIASFMTSVTQSGYKRQDNDEYLKKSLPPLEFTYSQATIQKDVRDIDAESLENLPQGLDGSQYQWVDLDGEGTPGILTEQGGNWFYKRNLSPHPIGPENDDVQSRVCFGPAEQVASKPNATLTTGQSQFMDLAGDGQLDLVQLEGSVCGFYECTDDTTWEAFRPFKSWPNLDTQDPNLKFVDLTGDGHADILISEDQVLAWYESLREEGFAVGAIVQQALDEEQGPRLVFADGTQSIYLADFSGDGLTDLARIRNGEVCYWPNMGYGRFGAKVMMDNSPWFDNPDQFNQSWIRLADIDGSGTTDIIYLGCDGVDIYLNQSGNKWCEPHRLSQFPHIDNLSAVMAVDILGNGTMCLVWSSPLPGDVGQQMRYIDLMGGKKPHLLKKVVNNLGAETLVHYAPSTKFYLKDKQENRPWNTKLPFPVHVVERVDTYDRISRNRFVTRYAYHHGYFDGTEREFRGFGMVEKWDTEEYAALSGNDEFPEATNIDAVSHVPPVLTKTWFHTGAYLKRESISRHFESEYYRESGLQDDQVEALLLKDTVLPTTILHTDGTWIEHALSTEEARQACRALKGSILRQEIYTQDGTSEQGNPYTVSERNYTIEVLQPQAQNRHGVFFVHPRETVDYHYERHTTDPRVSHQMTLRVDPFGNVERSATIAYQRRPLPDNLPEQEQTHVTMSVSRFANQATDPHWYRVGVLIEARMFEIVKPPDPETLGTIIKLFPFETIDILIENLFPSDQTDPSDTQVWPYESWNWRNDPTVAPPQTRLRLIEHERTIYRADNLSQALSPGQIQSRALPYETYKLAFTPGLIAEVYDNRVTDEMLQDGGYVHFNGDSNWWIPSGRIFYSPNHDDTFAQEKDYAEAHFFLPCRFRDPFYTDQFNTETKVVYDLHDLLVLETQDPLGNLVTAGERDAAGNLTKQGNNYRVLQPQMVMDSNRNCSMVTIDVLGMVVGTAVMGKPEESLGDSLDGFDPDLDEATMLAHFNDPLSDPHSILQKATTRLVYDLNAYRRSQEEENAEPQPAVVYTIARETHESDLGSGQQTKVQHSFSYSDGFGREIQKKIQAEPEKINGVAGPPRWVGSGWTIFNNKGKPVQKYEPFFSPNHLFEFGKTVGITSTLFYDPVNRVIATLHPNDTYEKVVFDPWRQVTYDINDTVAAQGLETGDPRTDKDIKGYVARYFAGQPAAWQTWYVQRQAGALGVEEQAAATKAAIHANTPTTANFDTLGQPFHTVAHNRFEHNGFIVNETYSTHIDLDIEGNERIVRDAKDRVVMRYDYSIIGPEQNEDNGAVNRIHQASMEAGERWTLNDVIGKPIRAWDSRGHRFTTEYDRLRRPLRQWVRGTDPVRSDPHALNQDIVFESTEYGEDQNDDVLLNLRTRVFKQHDSAGIVTNMGYNPDTNQQEAYDYKGNLLRSSRRLAQDYKGLPDWSQNPAMENETFTSSTQYDALNRPVTLTTPDNSVIQPAYNEANLLERVDANLRGSDLEITFVDDIDYNARGQRVLIRYGNGAETTYSYDPATFRLIRLRTERTQHPATERIVQNLNYTYDPVGNITHIRDGAQQSIYFSGQVADPSNDYTYDALYRLIGAHGREHIGQVGQPIPSSWDDKFRVNLAHPHDGQKMRPYTETYEYDEVGNILKMIHAAANGDWTRSYTYNEASQLEATKKSNRLSSTKVGNLPEEPYKHDEHGNMIRMPHLHDHPNPASPNMHWDFEDQLTKVDLANGGTAYYVYAADGQRVRKAIARDNGTRKEERIYLGGFEIYREYNGSNGNVPVLERETLHIMDDKQRIALVETKTIENGNSINNLVSLQRYQYSNHLGSASLELDNEGEIISYEEYTPYGCTSFQAVNNAIASVAKRYRYTGKERDEESGFYYHGARYYPPWLGRWASADPEDLLDGSDAFVYVRNSPTVLTDTTGRQCDAVAQSCFDFTESTPLEDLLQQCIPEEHPVIGLTPTPQVVSSSPRIGFTAISGQPQPPGIPPSPYSQQPRIGFTAAPGQPRPPGTPPSPYSQQPRIGFTAAPGQPRPPGTPPSPYAQQPRIGFTAAPGQPRPPGTPPSPYAQQPRIGFTAAPGQPRPPGTPPSPYAQQPRIGFNPPPGPPRLPGTPPSPYAQQPRIGFGRQPGQPSGVGVGPIVLVILLKPAIDNFIDFLMGGLRLDPEARLRHADVLYITREDVQAAKAQRAKREYNQFVQRLAEYHGISESEIRSRLEEAARRGPSYPTIGPAR